ncbi:ATP-binding cassette domain-containing protein [Plantactinospora sp. KBS50]|uniref:ABC transporter ATP-binding protein n=1 Tax=Plantactinospora sp. KBS50 TaxID=2024580 RepID=UPI000BAAE51A|nr:ATP-binding cassette domain-containing protein [Plantactinospora sp. KBS50]ASW56770.1 ABC transporter ATP-binding protein [Plantactinospora sp. KBS50]
MTDNLVRTTDLTKRYGGNQALDRVSLTVRRGEVYGFLGPNGAGKTTALRILLGLIRPTSGRVEVLGGRPGEPATLARIGMLLESGAFYPYLSGRDNLRAFARYCRVREPRVDEVLEIVSLTDRAQDAFARYSLGMKQRLGLAAALLKDPELLILDEPTNGLDPAGMADIRVLIRRLADDGRTVLLSSHMLGEVQHVCDRVGMIAHGRLLREGTVDELRGESLLAVEATPIGQAQDIAEGVLGADRVSVAGDTLRLRAPATEAAEINRALVLGGVAVHTLTRTERSLEDIFFEVTQSRRAEPGTAGTETGTGTPAGTETGTAAGTGPAAEVAAGTATGDKEGTSA